MRRKTWKSLLASLGALGAIAVTGAVALAATRGERRPMHPEVGGWLSDLPAAADTLQPHSPTREMIERGDLDAARAELSFRPLGEAPLPEGFPPYTPVGVIEVKEYPAYRKAVGGSFWPLFNHIQAQGIPMTAPVEMSRGTAARGDGQMAFLYQNTGVGELGSIDGVAVEDTPPTLVASLGMRGGRRNGDRLEDARRRLESWLDEQDEYRRVGEGDASFRLFGYNSPMVPDGDKYWEAQLLIEPIDAPSVNASGTPAVATAAE